MSEPTITGIVLGFPEYRQPARRLADKACLDYADVEIHSFPDGESLVRLPQTLPEQVILFTSLDQPNHRLVELELAAATALQLGGRRLILVAPYLCYMRQDKAFRPGEAVSQQIIGAMLARRFDTLITVDPHLHRTHTLKEAVPTRRAVAVNAAPAMAAWLQENAGRYGDKPLLVGPDEESEQWLRAIAAPGRLEYVVACKERLGDRDVRIHLPEFAFQRRHVVLVDDIASTGRTLEAAARKLFVRRAASVSALVSHALFIGDTLRRLEAAGVGSVYSTDSIPHPTNRIYLNELLAEALLENRLMAAGAARESRAGDDDGVG